MISKIGVEGIVVNLWTKIYFVGLIIGAAVVYIDALRRHEGNGGGIENR